MIYLPRGSCLLAVMIAEHFTTWTPERLAQLRVQPPYDPSQQALWVRGSIRFIKDGRVSQFVFTGPKMRVCYSGCNWNRVVCAMPGAGVPETWAFEQWLKTTTSAIRDAIWSDPAKFRPGALNASRFVMEEPIKPAKDSFLYPDELVLRLSTTRVPATDTEETHDVPNTLFFYVDGNGQEHQMEASDITAGSEIVPIIRTQYFRNNDRFGLVFTVLKAQVFPPSQTETGAIRNEDWVMDYR